MYDSIYDSAFRNIIFRNIIPQQLAPGRNGRESPLARLHFICDSVSQFSFRGHTRERIESRPVF